MCTPFYILGSVLLISLLETEISMAHPPHYSKHIYFAYLNMPRVTGFSCLKIDSFGFDILFGICTSRIWNRIYSIFNREVSGHVKGVSVYAPGTISTMQKTKQRSMT